MAIYLIEVEHKAPIEGSYSAYIDPLCLGDPTPGLPYGSRVG